MKRDVMITENVWRLCDQHLTDDSAVQRICEDVPGKASKRRKKVDSRTTQSMATTTTVIQRKAATGEAGTGGEFSTQGINDMRINDHQTDMENVTGVSTVHVSLFSLSWYVHE